MVEKTTVIQSRGTSIVALADRLTTFSGGGSVCAMAGSAAIRANGRVFRNMDFLAEAVSTQRATGTLR
ncbi:MAG: hypothetical protein Fur0014_01580 [Rubrivivax sp.]